MYVPKHFEQSRLSVLHAFMREHPFVTLITDGVDGIEANHVPVILDTTCGELGTLQGHVARANPVWQQVSPGADVLAIFQGANAYVSPSWYPSMKKHGKGVPTWNYLVVHAKGKVRWIQEPDWLLTFLETLTDSHEKNLATRWKVSDAPSDYIEAMMKCIVGFEIVATEVKGKWKLSQNRDNSDRLGVISALAKSSDQAACVVAEMMAEADDGGIT